MDKESFLEAVRRHYTDEIHETFLECEHDDGREVDFVRLNQSLGRLMANACAEGLKPQEFEDLVRSILPQIAGQLRFPKPKAA